MTGERDLKQQMGLLIELQKIDLALKALNEKRLSLPEKAKELDSDFQARKERIEEERQGLEGLNKLHKEKESELKQGQEKLKRAKDRLLEVKTNKEYQAILTEIETIGQANGKIEEDILVLYDRIDEKKVQLKTHEKDFQTGRNDYERERKDIEEALASIDGAFEEQQKKFDGVVVGLAPDVRRRYEMIKGRRNGLAVVGARKGICMGCNMNIPPQLYNDLLKYEQLICCPNCNRIIYWEDNSNEG